MLVCMMLVHVRPACMMLHDARMHDACYVQCQMMQVCGWYTHLQTWGVQQGCLGAAYSERNLGEKLGGLWSMGQPAVHNHPATIRYVRGFYQEILG